MNHLNKSLLSILIFISEEEKVYHKSVRQVDNQQVGWKQAKPPYADCLTLGESL